jgi:hypothetical protein
MKLYTKMGAPIESADPKTGYVAFEEGFNEANFSRQFTPEQFRHLVGHVDLDMSRYDAEGITHLGILEKLKVRRADERVPVAHQMVIAASVAAIVGLFCAHKVTFDREYREHGTEFKIMEIGPGVFARIDRKTGGIWKPPIE